MVSVLFRIARRIAYRVCAPGAPGHIRERLAEFRSQWTAQRGAEELRNLFQRIEMSKETYGFRAFTRLKQLNFLKRTQQVDEDTGGFVSY